MLPSGRNQTSTSDAQPTPDPTKEIVVQEDPILREIAERLESLDPDTLTPREALEALYAMRSAMQKSLDGKHLED